jgi:tRNA threonylcarbamoyl adenosine modification protein YeaZ
MLTLALTSSTALVGVAVARNGEVVAEESVMTERRHAETITPMVQEVLHRASSDIRAVGRIVVDVGPGRYTGLRVGITTATMLAFALSVPVVTVTSFELLGWAVGEVDHRGPIYAVVDARRDQVFAGVVRNGDHGTGPLVLSPAELTANLTPDSLLVGDGADRYIDEFAGFATVHAGVVPDIGAGALHGERRPSTPVAMIEPMYLREPDAAINIKTRPGFGAVT